MKLQGLNQEKILAQLNKVRKGSDNDIRRFFHTLGSKLLSDSDFNTVDTILDTEEELTSMERNQVYSLLKKGLDMLPNKSDNTDSETTEPRKPKMRVLVACEESQVVTLAFRAKGHDAFSADIKEATGPNPEYHLQGDVRDILNDGWDLIIAHPPCTHLAVSGARYFPEKIADGRQQAAIDFFMDCANANAPKICIENPVGIMSTKWRKPDQYIHPYHFGDSASKKTGLWLKGLPKLEPTNIVDPGEFVEWIDKKTGKKKRQAKWYLDALTAAKGDPEIRSTLRSKTFPGIAQAMADQWG